MHEHHKEDPLLPMPDHVRANYLRDIYSNDKVKLNGIGFTSMVRALIEKAGDDPFRPGVLDTPLRFLKAWEFWTSGYNQDPATVLKTFEDGAQGCDEMIAQRDISFFSLCEHHLAPFFGVVHIGYIPNGRIVGLSKLARLVEVFARRLQVQERLTNQIAEALDNHLQPVGVGVVVEARHLCMESRGVQKSGTSTVTSALRGVFKTKPEARAEFLSFVRSK